MHPLYNDMEEIFMTAIRAVDPYHAVKAAVAFDGQTLTIEKGVFQAAHPEKPMAFSHDLSKGSLYVVGAGKAASKMALAVEEILGEIIGDGIIITKYGYVSPLKKIRQIEAGHPVPDQQGLEGTKEIETLLRNTSPRDLVLVLISGGGSSLLVSPAPGISLEEKQQVTQLLLSSGATIQEMNTVRKHLSAIKGGHLARLAAPTQVITLILSDVIGDDISSIASGPTAPDDTSFREALDILSSYGLTGKVPLRVLEHLQRGARGTLGETPTSQDPLFKSVFYYLIGSNQIALDAAANKARNLGYHSLILTHGACGEAREIAKYFAAIGKQLTVSGQPVTPPACILSGGEPTVTLHGNGKGGRNQEFALSAGVEIEGVDDILIASVGTDGTDGPTDAAGGVADGHLMKAAREHHLNVHEYLSQNNAYPLLDQLGYLIKTGPTGTNVMDIQIILCKKP